MNNKSSGAHQRYSVATVGNRSFGWMTRTGLTWCEHCDYCLPRSARALIESRPGFLSSTFECCPNKSINYFALFSQSLALCRVYNLSWAGYPHPIVSSVCAHSAVICIHLHFLHLYWRAIVSCKIDEVILALLKMMLAKALSTVFFRLRHTEGQLPIFPFNLFV